VSAIVSPANPTATTSTRLALMAPRLKVALLFGGRSGEHEVSLRSAAAVAEGLAERHEVIPVLIDRGGRWWLQSGSTPMPEGGVAVFLAPSPHEAGRLQRLTDAEVVARPDIYFPILHGPYGEDGTIQGLLELASIPYVGSGVAASAVAMDKELMKTAFARAGLPLGPYEVLRSRDPEGETALAERLGLPLFVKPANLGSSVGVTRVPDTSALPAAIEAAFGYDRKVVVEAAIDARELEVSVLGNSTPESSIPGEVVPDREFYDYDSKYSADSRAQVLIPAPVGTELAAQARELATRAFRAVDACGFARVDLFLDRSNGRFLVNEINTIPGFTSISMFPKLWQATGLPFPELLGRLVDLARDRHAERSRLKTSLKSAPDPAGAPACS